jgi:hypothetical protein
MYLTIRVGPYRGGGGAGCGFRGERGKIKVSPQGFCIERMRVYYGLKIMTHSILYLRF